MRANLLFQPAEITSKDVHAFNLEKNDVQVLWWVSTKNFNLRHVEPDLLKFFKDHQQILRAIFCLKPMKDICNPLLLKLVMIKCKSDGHPTPLSRTDFWRHFLCSSGQICPTFRKTQKMSSKIVKNNQNQLWSAHYGHFRSSS